MTRERHLVTGATGFVGGAIVLELLDKTDADVVCLARPAGDTPAAAARLGRALGRALHAYGRERDFGPEVARRCHAVAGDLTRPLCGADPAELGPVTEIWHCAASLEFEDENEEEIFRTNVEGTEAAVELARELGCESFNYVSTAYVAGKLGGTIRETVPPLDSAVNNAYEKSKIHAEHVVSAARDLHVRILRPSIVIGHSRTYAATSFTGMYGFLRGLRTLKREVSKRLGDFLAHRPLRFLADPETPMNLIPVDFVARNGVALALNGAGAGVYHLTNACPAPLGVGVELACKELGLRAPRFVGSEREFTSLDRELNRQITFYAPYMRDDKEFDRANVDAILGARASWSPLPREELRRYVRWYLDRLAIHSRRAIPSVRPAAAAG